MLQEIAFDLTVGANGTVAFRIPRAPGSRVRVIVRDELPAAGAVTLTEEERFQLGAYAAATPQDAEEDARWARYLHD